MPQISNQGNIATPSTIPEGFGKNVNDYLNHYVTVADAKAAAILASNFILLGTLINIDVKTKLLITLFFLAGIFSVISIVFCVTSIYPRFGKAEKGPIFWEGIKRYQTLNDYIQELGRLNPSKVELEYGKQNWHVSQVLSVKNYHVRCSLWAFVISLMFLSILYTITKFS